jgi:hypothetical protein
MKVKKMFSLSPFPLWKVHEKQNSHRRHQKHTAARDKETEELLLLL